MFRNFNTTFTNRD